MDALDYGIIDPKLALMNNGQVFVAGQYEPPMNPPTSQTQAQTSGIRAMDVSQPISTITAGSDLFGAITTGLPVFNVQSVQFQSGIPVSYLDSTSGDREEITEANWTTSNAGAIVQGNGSLFPAVYAFNVQGGNLASVAIKLTGIPASLSGTTGQLIGSIPADPLSGVGAPPLVMTGSVQLVNGFQTVSMTMKLPKSFGWYHGDIYWDVTLPNGSFNGKVSSVEATRLEVFVTQNAPGSIFSPNGVWPEAMRVLFSQGNFSGINSDAAATAWVTNILFNYSGNISYDTTHGGSALIAGNPNTITTGGTFRLTTYLNSRGTIPAINVNCYDMAGGVQTFASAVGAIWTTWTFLGQSYYPINDTTYGITGNIFGFINSTHLIGIPRLCNNPFFTAGDGVFYPQPLDPSYDDADRSCFGNHVFIVDTNDLVYDACSGPHLGTEPFHDLTAVNNYLVISVDGFLPADPHHNLYWLEGVAQPSQAINYFTGITGVQ
jgi:hypothetical protein